ncbi:16S rRNA (cytosine(967)-C(5))-methyltransferase RsmB [Acidihalobacter prosperus]|uniref:16S rRNA (cytosine(967)-C(5))-methyltransferase RsmB n=1 Tax=Acidihalobacter prosperus TaxID=160660 RepID=UPI0009EE7076|nr:16S rRNA (cytosine(967)-C(5))-methyltransferase RsmB [Acidihalobacter prosperus]
MAKRSTARPPDPRALAVEVVDSVRRQGRSLSQALPRAERQLAAGPPRALLRERAYGLLRYAPRLDAWLDALVTQPLRARDAPVARLIQLGLYELFFLRTPDYAAVNEAVALAGRLGRPWAARLVNGVLRNAQRREAELTALTARVDSARLAHPDWLIERIRGDWGDAAEAVFAANNARAPMTLRINRAKTDIETYAAMLRTEGIGAKAGRHAPDSLVLAQPVDVEALPGFRAGWVSVQDEAAQLAAGLVAASPAHRVLDACAAPGGKTAHLIERAGGTLDITAVEIEPDRLARVDDTLRRLDLSAHLLAADAGMPRDWWDGRAYDRILLDAPCSATGVIRRHPDIKLLRRASDIAGLAERQQALLEALWPLLAQGGRLVYATCSIVPDENQRVIEHFMRNHADATEWPIVADWGRAMTHGRQILPGEDGMDGFYYACLLKAPT